MDVSSTPNRPPVQPETFDSPQFQEPGDTLDLLEFPSPETLRDFCHLDLPFDLGGSDDELEEELGEDEPVTAAAAVAQLWAFSDLAGAPGSERKSVSAKGRLQSWKRSGSDSRLDLAGSNYFFFDDNILNDGEASDPEDLDSSLDEVLDAEDGAVDRREVSSTPAEYDGEHVDAASYVLDEAFIPAVLFQEPGDEDALLLIDYPETRNQGDDDLPFAAEVGETSDRAADADLQAVVDMLVDAAIHAAVEEVEFDGEATMFQEPGDEVAMMDFPETRDFGDDDFFRGTEEESDAADAAIAAVASANIHYYGSAAPAPAPAPAAGVELTNDGTAALATTSAAAPLSRPGTSTSARPTSNSAGLDTPIAAATATFGVGSKGLFKNVLGRNSKHSTPQIQMCAARNDEELTPQTDSIQGKSEMIARRILAFGTNSPLPNVSH